MKSVVKQNLRAMGIGASMLFASTAQGGSLMEGSESSPSVSPISTSSSRVPKPVIIATSGMGHDLIKKVQSDESLKQAAQDDEIFGYTDLSSLTIVAGSGSSELAAEISK